MKLTIVFATNSGSTLLVAQRLQVVCQSEGHEVTLIDAHSLSPDQLAGSEALIVGTPSYDLHEQEGQPHDAYEQFLSQYPDWRCDGIKMAIFGLGDSSYQHFCGGVEVLTEWLQSRGAVISADPLKIDGFYYQDPEESMSLATDWVKRVLATF